MGNILSSTEENTRELRYKQIMCESNVRILMRNIEQATERVKKMSKTQTHTRRLLTKQILRDTHAVEVYIQMISRIHTTLSTVEDAEITHDIAQSMHNAAGILKSTNMQMVKRDMQRIEGIKTQMGLIMNETRSNQDPNVEEEEEVDAFLEELDRHHIEEAPAPTRPKRAPYEGLSIAHDM